MNQGKYVFTQIIESISRYRFDQCVQTYKGNQYIKSFSSYEQFLAMSFGQLAYRESLRDIVVCLSSHKAKLYHLGFKGVVTKSTLADANEKRDWHIYQDLAIVLIKEARTLYAKNTSFQLDLDGAVYLLDSTSIELCLTLFPWAAYMDSKGATKLHMVMDLQGSIPTFFHITDGRVHDVQFLDVITYEAGAYYVMDRGYLDFRRLYTINQAGAFFVTRPKRDARFVRTRSRKVDKQAGLRCDQTVHLVCKKE